MCIRSHLAGHRPHQQPQRLAWHTSNFRSTAELSKGMGRVAITLVWAGIVLTVVGWSWLVLLFVSWLV